MTRRDAENLTDSRAARIEPLSIAETGDDSPASSIWRYAWRMTRWHQPVACLVALCVAFLNLAPIELHRRIIDDAIVGRDPGQLVWLGLCYGIVLIGHRVLKFSLGLYQTWLSESTIRYTRTHLLKIHRRRSNGDDGEEHGQAVSVVGSEVDKLGGFVGEGPSRACADAAMLLGVIGYMAVVQPKIALLGLALMIPQIVLTPIMQSRLNRLMEDRLSLMRDLGDTVAASDDGTEPEPGRLLRTIYGNRMGFMFWKLFMKGALNGLNALAPLSVLLWGGWLAINGQTTVGVLVAFLSGFEKMSGPIRGLISFYRTAAQAEVQHRMVAKWMKVER